MSAQILEIARLGLQQAKRHPLNYYDWRVRREIYRLLNMESTSVPNPRHQSLAIQAAEHVIPLFVPLRPDDQLVYRMLEAAKAFSKGQVDAAAAHEIAEEGYHSTDLWGCDFQKDTINYQSAHAGFAAYKALVEVRALIDPWEHVERYARVRGSLAFGGEPYPETWTPGTELTDREWCYLAATGDTAAAAAFAYATTTDSNHPVRSLLIEFWEWWADIALPRALKAQPKLEE